MDIKTLLIGILTGLTISLIIYINKKVVGTEFST